MSNFYFLLVILSVSNRSFQIKNKILKALNPGIKFDELFRPVLYGDTNIN